MTVYVGCNYLSLSLVPDSATSVLNKQYIPKNMHTGFALLGFVVVIHWLVFPYPSGLLHWHCGNLTIAPVPAKQPWWIWINTSCEFIMNDCITTTKQSTTKPCAYFLGYTVTLTFSALTPSAPRQALSELPSLFSSRPWSVTLAPALAKSSAIWAPIPELAPGMMALCGEISYGI